MDSLKKAKAVLSGADLRMVVLSVSAVSPFYRFGIALLLLFLKYEHPFSHVCQCIGSKFEVSCFEGRATASSRAKNLIGRFPEI